MGRFRGERVLAVVGASALLVLGFDGLTYAATGSSLLLGKLNKAGAPTTIQNTGKGAALNLLTKSPAYAPFTTNAKGLVNNLYAARAANANKVGGLTVAQITTAAKGATGAAGPKGDTGAAGPAGPLLSVLASGQTVTGSFGIEDQAAAAAEFHGVLVSYPFPVATSPTVVYIPVGGPNPDATHCAGTTTAPTAAAGYLCIYEQLKSNLSTTPTVYGLNGSLSGPKTHGTLLQFTSLGGAAVIELGTFALTAA